MAHWGPNGLSQQYCGLFCWLTQAANAAHRVAFELGPICHSITTPWWGHAPKQACARTVARMREQTARKIRCWDREAELKPPQDQFWALVPLPRGATTEISASLFLIHNNHTFDKSDIYRRSLCNPQNQAQLLDDTQMHKSRNRGREKVSEEHWANIILPQIFWWKQWKNWQQNKAQYK